ncbi:Carboxy-cis,cis-muconate cyclase [Teratosphaeria destructans]|uniref:Carboxy-cis,cis-muconate cyclase n=1 Tax=Teratosphaeria destructans TaxID=418781 RepID=A0A9W7SP38_9PEZI|nr:Carboxy-cis,cis-muconate cyclase [Teratosphaeria destructans]
MKHHLFIGTWTPPGAIFTITFDDETHALTLLHRTPIPPDEPISWLTLSHDRTHLYGAALKKWSSHAITTPTSLHPTASLPMGGDPRAADATTRTRAIFVLAAQKPPYCVYGNPFYDHAGFINVHAVRPDGTLDRNIQDRPAPTPPPPPSLPPFFKPPPSRTKPPSLFPTPTTHTPTYTTHTYPLIPPDFATFHPNMYRSDVVCVSCSGRYLFATARANAPHLTGYISVFRLRDTGEVERQLCLNPTVTSGGHSNAVAPCPWSDEWVALTDDEQGFVEVYRWKDEWLGRVAHLDVKEPGFGMNAAWYD